MCDCRKKKCVAVAWNLFLCSLSLSNNASLSAVIAYLNVLIFLIFSLITTFTFNKYNVSSIRISTLHTYILFIIFFSVSKLKDNLSDKVFIIENQLPIKTNQLTDSYHFVQSKYFFSSALGYTRFKQPHDKKKLRFSVTLLN